MNNIRLFAALTALLALLALAGDEPLAQVAYTGTQGCTSALAPNKRYSVQCTSDCYVRVTSNSTTGPATSTTSVKVPADKLYDVYTTRTKLIICGIQSSASGTMKVFTFQGAGEP